MTSSWPKICWHNRYCNLVPGYRDVPVLGVTHGMRQTLLPNTVWFRPLHYGVPKYVLWCHFDPFAYVNFLRWKNIVWAYSLSSSSFSHVTGWILVARHNNQLACKNQVLWSSIKYHACCLPDPDMLFPMEDIQGNTLVGSHPALVSGGAKIVPGILGSALYLDGINGVVDFGNDPMDCLTEPEMCPDGLTIAFWLKIHKYPTGDQIAIILNSLLFVGETGIQYRIYPEYLRFRLNINGRKWGYNVPLPPLFKWQFITTTFLTDTFDMYINGCSVSLYNPAEPTLNPGSGTNYKLYLGGGTGNPRFVYSEITIDQLMVWHEYLSTETVWQLYFQGGQVLL